MLTNSEIIKKLETIFPLERLLTSVAESFVYAQDALVGERAKIVPVAIVFPETVEEVEATACFANENLIPLTPRAAGTNLVGGCVPTTGGIVIDFSRMNKIIEINPKNLTATVQSGIVIGDLQAELDKYGLMYAPDPSNLAVSTIAGSIAQNSSGAKSFKYGSTKDYILALKIVLATGKLLETGSPTAKNANGYNLTNLFVGSEGTLGLVCEATLKLIPKPQASRVLMGYFDKVSDATSAVDTIIAARLRPSTIELMDKNALCTVEKFAPTGLLCNKQAALIVEVDGNLESVTAEQAAVEKVLKNCGATDLRVAKTNAKAQKIWAARRSSFAAAAKLAPDVISEDLIVGRDKMAELVSGIQYIAEKYSLKISTVGHVGDGNVHPQIAINARNEQEWHNFCLAKDEIFNLALNLGGKMSAEHGIGLAKKDYMEKAVGKTALSYMKQIKQIFDPNNILNAGKIF